MGKTNIKDLKLKIKTVEGCSGVSSLKGMKFEYSAGSYSEDGIIEGIGYGKVKGNDLPLAWRNKGLSWDMTSDQWMDKLSELGFGEVEEQTYKMSSNMGLLLTKINMKTTVLICWTVDKNYAVQLTFSNDEIKSVSVGTALFIENSKKAMQKIYSGQSLKDINKK